MESDSEICSHGTQTSTHVHAYTQSPPPHTHTVFWPFMERLALLVTVGDPFMGDPLILHFSFPLELILLCARNVEIFHFYYEFIFLIGRKINNRHVCTNTHRKNTVPQHFSSNYFRSHLLWIASGVAYAQCLRSEHGWQAQSYIKNNPRLFEPDNFPCIPVLCLPQYS